MEGDEIRFVVSDTGIGIAQSDIEDVMEPFYQLPTADGTSAKNSGLGLGLAISNQIAVLLGGSLTVTSMLGEGSVFSLALPLTAPGAAGI